MGIEYDRGNQMISTLRRLGSDCGVAVRFDRAEEERVAAALAEQGVPINGIHALQ